MRQVAQSVQFESRLRLTALVAGHLERRGWQRGARRERQCEERRGVVHVARAHRIDGRQAVEVTAGASLSFSFLGPSRSKMAVEVSARKWHERPD